MKNENIKTMVEGSMCIALSFVLSLVVLYQLPNGGGITAASASPLVLFSIRRGVKWGLLASSVFVILQLMTGFYPPPVPSLFMFALVIFLDYAVAFGVLGLAGMFYKSNSPASGAFGAAAVLFVRFMCHFASGILVWNVYAPEGQPVWLYSLIYNGSYMAFEIVINAVVTYMLVKLLLSSKILSHKSS